jgi:hypothetical protein
MRNINREGRIKVGGGVPLIRRPWGRSCPDGLQVTASSSRKPKAYPENAPNFLRVDILPRVREKINNKCEVKNEKEKHQNRMSYAHHIDVYVGNDIRRWSI